MLIINILYFRHAISLLYYFLHRVCTLLLTSKLLTHLLIQGQYMKLNLYFLTFCIPGFLFAQENEFHLDKEYGIDPNGTIELYSDDAQISITGTTRNTAHIKIDRKLVTKGVVSGEKEFKVDVSSKEGNLIIRQKEEGNISVVGYMNEEYTIAIEAPQGSSLKLKGDDDNYVIRNINGSITIENDDGDATLEHCGGNYFEFNFDDGDIYMNEGRGTLIVDLDDSNIEVLNGKFDKIEARNDDGDLIIETSLADDGEYSLETNDADIEFTITEGGGDFEIRHDDSSLHTSNQFNIIEEDDHFTHLTLPSGNAKVKIRTDDSQVSMNVL